MNKSKRPAPAPPPPAPLTWPEAAATLWPVAVLVTFLVVLWGAGLPALLAQILGGS